MKYSSIVLHNRFMKEQKSFLIPMAFLGLMFFTCGFSLGIKFIVGSSIEGVVKRFFNGSIYAHWCNILAIPYLWLSCGNVNQQDRI